MSLVQVPVICRKVKQKSELIGICWEGEIRRAADTHAVIETGGFGGGRKDTGSNPGPEMVHAKAEMPQT